MRGTIVLCASVSIVNTDSKDKEKFWVISALSKRLPSKMWFRLESRKPRPRSKQQDCQTTNMFTTPFIIVAAYCLGAIFVAVNAGDEGYDEYDFDD